MFELIVKTLAEYVEVEAENITPEADFIDDLKMNSYDFISLIGALEEKLCIEIPDTEIMDLRTVGDVAEYLKAKLQ